MITHGKDAVFSLDNAAGSLIALTTYTTEVSMDLDTDIHDVSTFGVGSRAKITGIKDGRFSAKFFDTIAYTHLAGLYGKATSTSFVYGPAGSATGAPRISGECWMKTLPVNSSVNEPMSYTATFEVTGAVTLDVY
jgi:hypothetical protein